MRFDEVPNSVAQFLRENVESFEELEIVLLLHRERAQPWTTTALSSRLRTAAPLIEAALSALAGKRLIKAESDRPGSYLWAASADAALDETIGCLAGIYATDPIKIMRLMSAHAIERVRTAALRTFVDAFVLRKDKDKDKD